MAQDAREPPPSGPAFLRTEQHGQDYCGKAQQVQRNANTSPSGYLATSSVAAHAHSSWKPRRDPAIRSPDQTPQRDPHARRSRPGEPPGEPLKVDTSLNPPRAYHESTILSPTVYHRTLASSVPLQANVKVGRQSQKPTCDDGQRTFMIADSPGSPSTHSNPLSSSSKNPPILSMAAADSISDEPSAFFSPSRLHFPNQSAPLMPPNAGNRQSARETSRAHTLRTSSRSPAPVRDAGYDHRSPSLLSSKYSSHAADDWQPASIMTQSNSAREVTPHQPVYCSSSNPSHRVVVNWASTLPSDSSPTTGAAPGLSNQLKTDDVAGVCVQPRNSCDELTRQANVDRAHKPVSTSILHHGSNSPTRPMATCERPTASSHAKPGSVLPRLPHDSIHRADNVSGGVIGHCSIVRPSASATNPSESASLTEGNSHQQTSKFAVGSFLSSTSSRSFQSVKGSAASRSVEAMSAPLEDAVKPVATTTNSSRRTSMLLHRMSWFQKTGNKGSPGDTDLAAEKEGLDKRQSTTSLPGLIRRALRLATMMESGRTQSRWGTDWMLEGGSSKESNDAHRAETQDLISAFPRPSRNTTPQNCAGQRPLHAWPQSTLREMERLATPEYLSRATRQRNEIGRRRCCGMPRWLFWTLCLIAIVVVAVAVLVPVTLVVIPSQLSTNATPATVCAGRVTCENDSSPILTTANTCACVCINGYEGPTCTQKLAANSSCASLMLKSGPVATVGKALPDLLAHAASTYGIPIDSEKLAGLFSSRNLSCDAQNALVTLNGVPSSGGQDQHRRRDGAALPKYNVASALTTNFARTGIMYVFQTTRSLDAAIAAQNAFQDYYVHCGIDSIEALHRTKTTRAMAEAGILVTLVPGAWNANLVDAKLIDVVKQAVLGGVARSDGNL